MSLPLEEAVSSKGFTVCDEGPEPHELDERGEDHILIMRRYGRRKPHLYTKVMDCFREHVKIMISAGTRLWPEFGVPGLKSATDIVVPEPERRRSHIAMIDPNHGLLPNEWCKPKKCAVQNIRVKNCRALQFEQGSSGEDGILSIEAIEESADQFLKNLRGLEYGFVPTSEKHVPRMPFKMYRNNKSVKVYASTEAILNHSEETIVQQLNRNLSETFIPEPEERVPPDIPSKTRQKISSTSAISEETIIPQFNQRPNEEDHVSTVETIQYSQEGAFQIPRKLVLPHDRGPPSVRDPEKHVPLDIPSKTRQSAKTVPQQRLFRLQTQQ